MSSRKISRKLLTAAWVAPMTAPPVPDAGVVFSDGGIEAVGAARELRSQFPDAEIEARVDECQHISPADLERERRSMAPAVFAREYENAFDSLETRFFDADAIAAAFGAVSSPTPPIPEGDLDPIITRTPAFGERAFFS